MTSFFLRNSTRSAKRAASSRLGELVERVEAVPELGAVPVLREDAIAEAVDRGNGELREVTAIADLASGGGQAVAHFEGGLLGKGAEHQLPGLRPLKQ